ncbi:ribulose-phosphate 3-epimerase [bacterium]|nr:ribulose-phosphate 3-epimerase [bacterium]
MALLAPSILSADFGNLQRDFEMLNESKADWFHVDVMDGVFVPNISFGFPVLKALKKVAQKPIDVHLMVVNPEKYIEEFREAGADIITVHAEACPHLHRTIQQIKASGAKAGVSLNPHTPVSTVKHLLADMDMLLLMSVNPGFGGQKFLPLVYDKLEELSHIRPKNLVVEIDGGVDLNNCGQLVQSGADVLVAGSAVFNTDSPTETIGKFKQLIG